MACMVSFALTGLSVQIARHIKRDVALVWRLKSDLTDTDVLYCLCVNVYYTTATG
jgi:hypothetical protein